MARINNREQLREWLSAESHEVAVGIAARAALRVLPLICGYVAENVEERASAIVLPVFRALALPWFAATWPDQGRMVSSAASIAASSADRVAEVSTSATATIRAAVTAATFAAQTVAIFGAAATNVVAAESATRAASIAATFADGFGSSIWSEVESDANVIRGGGTLVELMRRPLWSGVTPSWFNSNWIDLKSHLLTLDRNWRVWTDWYDDRWRGTEHPESLSPIESLELERVLLPDKNWENGPDHVNAVIAAIEREYRTLETSIDTGPSDEEIYAEAPPQQPAIIEVEPGEDGKLYRRPSGVPVARDETQEQRLRAAWAAQSEQLTALEAMDPGKNLPALGAALAQYRGALGSAYEYLNVIALGVHGTRLTAFSVRADELLMPDVAAEVVSLAASHGLLINQFEAWRDYVSDAAGQPDAETVEAGLRVARATGELPDLIDESVVIAAQELADAAAPPMTANPEDRPPSIVQTELMNSVGNILSGLMTPLVDYARDAGSAAREGSLDGVKEAAKQGTQVLAWGAVAYFSALAAGLPAQFGWLIPVMALLKLKLKK